MSTMTLNSKGNGIHIAPGDETRLCHRNFTLQLPNKMFS